MKRIRFTSAVMLAFGSLMFVQPSYATCVSTQEAQTIAAAQVVSTDSTDVPVVTTLETCGGDDIGYQIPITATVTFDNHTYSSVFATTNSVITFGNADGTYWDYPVTPSISLYSMDWLIIPNAHSDEHLIIQTSSGGFQVDLSARPYGNYGVADPTNIVITAVINTDGTVAISYAVSGPTYDGQTRTGVRLTDGSIVTLESYGVVQVETPVVLPPAPVEPTPEVTSTPEATPTEIPQTPEQMPEPSTTPSPEPTQEQQTPVEQPTSQPEPTAIPSIDVTEPVVPVVPPVVAPPVIEPVPQPQPIPFPVVTAPEPEPTLPVETPSPEPIAEETPAPALPEVPEVLPEPLAPPEIAPPKEEKPSPELPIEPPIKTVEEHSITVIENLKEIDPGKLTNAQVAVLQAAALVVFQTAEQGSPAYQQALEALYVVAQADDEELPAELAAIPLLGNVASAVLDTFNELGNIGADMSPHEREKAKKEVIASIAVGQAVMSTGGAVASAAYRRKV